MVTYEDVVIERFKPLSGTERFCTSDLFFAVKHLPLEVAAADCVVINKAKRTDTCACEIEGNGGAQPSHTDDENARPSQFRLSFRPYLRQHDLPVITFCRKLFQHV